MTAGSSHAFGIPEKLVFDLTWTGIKAGTATLEIMNDNEVTKIISTARSADWVSVFYKVDDRIETMMSLASSSSFMGRPTNYRVKINEGRHRRNKEVVFNHEGRNAIYMDHINGKKQTFEIQGDTVDPLSSFYFVRKSQMEVGKSLHINIFDNKKAWDVEVQVLRKERIKTKLGTFDTVVIKPLMKSEGTFHRKGDMYIWLSDDAKRIPVMMKTKVVVGSVTATLVGGRY